MKNDTRQRLLLASGTLLVVLLTVMVISRVGARDNASIGALDEHRPELQHLLDAWREANGAPGAVLTISMVDGTGLQLTSGAADLETQEPIEADEPFDIASITKTFTAAALLQLAEEGKLSLDAPIGTYIGAFPRSETITIRQLLSHRSGLLEIRDDPDNFQRFGSDLGRRWTAQELLALAAQLEPSFAPGEGFDYTDTNYIVSAAIIEAVTGSSLAEVLRQRFFDPLGLEDTFYSSFEPTARPYNSGYLRCDGNKYAQAILSLYGDHVACDQGFLPLAQVPGFQGVTFHLGASGIVSTAEDLTTWARALLRGEVLNGNSLDEMLPSDAGSGDYGLGVQRFATPLGVSFGHTGGAPGVESVMLHLPEHDLVLVAFANGGTTGKLRFLVDDALGLLAGNRPSAALPDQPLNDLVQALQDTEPEVRRQAAVELGRKGPHAQEAVEALIHAMLHDAAWEVREAAALALGLTGPESRVVEPLQEASQNDTHEAVRRAAQAALSRFGR